MRNSQLSFALFESVVCSSLDAGHLVACQRQGAKEGVIVLGYTSPLGVVGVKNDVTLCHEGTPQSFCASVRPWRLAIDTKLRLRFFGAFAAATVPNYAALPSFSGSWRV